MKKALMAAAAGIALAAGAANAQTLRMGVGAQITSTDPHFHNISPNNAFASMVFDNLIETDDRARTIPGLAESWRPTGEDVWEFRLRRGVQFHNGQDFTAEDVAFTLERIPQVVNSPGSFRTYTQSIVGVEIVDPHTIRFRTNGPAPTLPNDIAMVPMLDRQTHQGATTEDFNAGRATIGTGPYRMTQHRPGERIELQRNESYWRGRPAWQTIDYRMITNDAARTAAVLAGDVDFIDQVPTTDIERLRHSPRVSLSEIDSLRFIYFAMDHMRDGPTPFITDNDGRPLPRNPLKDERVRRALSIAIDRAAIVSRVMEGAAAASVQVMPAGAFGYAPDLAVPPADVEAAKRLLAEAGYPNGFRLTVHGPNDRYPNDARISQAVGQMWTRIGVRTQVEVAPYASFIARASRQEFSVFLVSWGSSTGEPLAGLRSVAMTYNRERGTGSVNRGRYSNPEFDQTLLSASRELNDARREALLQDATRILVRDQGIITTHLQKNIWAMRQGFAHTPRVDERTRAQDVRTTSQ
ncbi:ABC transporter substrate-binding protein [Roseomonas terrae]|jgi:peptide/nickel transport system substrate-binding protein|uniref:ABC transporter substrate-binding protein n=1 Tax=Neoroseomonas terrae TaxID=424799 RepID=A0ABS5EPI4_9PROT|nr:ABC transporter substrate-binding protein [Neoroseomonas terrae]MBR0652954.1 ABC transporter substrate-binding protein [Neoroseomonas terrae]